MADVVAGPNGATRTSLSIVLGDIYASPSFANRYAKQHWKLERDALINQATQWGRLSQRAFSALTRQLAHITDTTRQAQLASKYSDAVVRGYSHTIRQYMGYMDIASDAETLQDANWDSFREAFMSSLDGSIMMNGYLVQLTPLDWFESLLTSFTMEDLTQNTDELDTLNSPLVALQMGSRGYPADLQTKVQEAQTPLSTTYFDTKGDELEVADDDEFAITQGKMREVLNKLLNLNDKLADLKDSSGAC
ncbi:hypothetical protein GGX14DRAFT_563184 [Mycena pura]|uniref:Uncharacterized protein n=1 Tax=Mycena pura TaxID=153505 RepID=A0AAD6YCX9_9AGAR|nr:hypothetical protein GGX14DRAFT_563184 [Mycena pura]